MKKTFVILFTCCLIYLTLELWAQYRFSLNNTTLPFGLRKNMGVNLYDAYKLSPNFSGTNHFGVSYKTDQNGFCINPYKETKFSERILIGGDSRAFSLFIDWDNSLAGQLESAGLGVYLQAFPGSSPAMFNHDVFDQMNLSNLSPKPKRIYYVYDRNDAFGDRLFSKELQNELPFYAPKRLKVAMGGFFWGMLNVKLRSFLKKTNQASNTNVEDQVEAEAIVELEQAKPHPPNSKTAHHPDFEVHEESLNKMMQGSRKQNIPLVMIYIPRFPELMGEDPYFRNLVKHWCEQSSVEFLDLYIPFTEICQNNVENIRPYFRDLEEGIHFSKEGLKVISDAILSYEEEHP